MKARTHTHTHTRANLGLCYCSIYRCLIRQNRVLHLIYTHKRTHTHTHTSQWWSEIRIDILFVLTHTYNVLNNTILIIHMHTHTHTYAHKHTHTHTHLIE